MPVRHSHKTRLAQRLVVAACAALCCAPAGASAQGGPVPVRTHLDPIDMTHGRPGPPAAPRLRAALSATHCGDNTSADRTAPSLGPLPAVKVIYAFPTDRVFFNTGARENFIQSEVKAATERAAAVSGATKTIRFDLGTNCAPNPFDFVDIQMVALPSAAAVYEGIAIGGRFNQIKADVLAALGPQEGARKFAVYAEGVRGTSGAEGVAGQAETPIDDSPDPGNGGNNSGQFAIVFGTADAAGDAFFGTDQQYPAEFLLHEVTHTLGAVQDSAPNSTGAGHCFQEDDVMCYADGGPKNTLIVVCPFGATNETYDCGQDDYLSPSPPPGSYLATKWNLQNSQFMCPLARCQTGGTPPVAALAGPAHGHVGSPFTLNAGGSTDDNGIAAYHFDIDSNGSFEVANGAAPTFTSQLNNEGFPSNTVVTHALKVAVTDTDSAISTAQLNFQVFPPIEIVGGVSTAKPKLKQKVTFDASKSVDPAGDPLTFAWDFDGNGTTDSTAPTATHAYKVPGTYSATVTVADTVGNAASAGIQVVVAEPAGPASVKKISLTPSTFVAFKSGPSALEPAATTGTTVKFTLNKSSKVKFTVEREVKVRGKRKYKAVKGSFSRSGKFGANVFRFTGRMKSKALAAGRYRLVALPSTKKSKPTRTPFKIVKK